jgi:hypothetical protein
MLGALRSWDRDAVDLAANDDYSLAPLLRGEYARLQTQCLKEFGRILSRRLDEFLLSYPITSSLPGIIRAWQSAG